MDFNRLSEFLVLASAGSVKSAAEKLGIPSNVLSTRLRGFEHSLGTVLIRRNAHCFELTESGEKLLAEAPRLLADYEGMLTSLQNVQGTDFKSLRLQLCAQTMPPELGPFLDVYCRQYPSLFLDLYDENSGDWEWHEYNVKTYHILAQKGCQIGRASCRERV